MPGILFFIPGPSEGVENVVNEATGFATDNSIGL